MFRISSYRTVVGLVIVLALPGLARARALYDRTDIDNQNPMATIVPNYCIAEHNVGKLVLSVNNNGTLGTGFAAGTASDCFTGSQVKSCEFPKGSNSTYLFAGAFWIGAVVGRDTLVSEGADGWLTTRELFPDPAPGGQMIHRSIIDPSLPEYDGAVSEQDYICTYTDTFPSLVSGVDSRSGRPHTPLNVGITQRSYAWSYAYAEDFVLFDYDIKNNGVRPLHDAYLGLYMDHDVYGPGKDGNQGAQDDICGFVPNLPTPPEFSGGCTGFRDTVFIAWIADNDGDPNGTVYDNTSVPNVTGTRIVRTPNKDLKVSFNWWVSNGNPAIDFGPQTRKKFRDLGTGGMGTPDGDVNKYAFLSNGEFDYDQVMTGSIQPTDTVWMPPNPILRIPLSSGFDTRYLLSFGPFDIAPGQVLPLSFAYVAGEKFHTWTKNLQTNVLDNYNPRAFYDSLHFEDFGLNAMWASWIYDNPGVDTDSNGYAGKFRVCNLDSVIYSIDTSTSSGITVIDTTYKYTQADTIWYEGDGVPDFRGASPPPAPITWLYPTVENQGGKIRVRFNGYRSETTKDIFSNKKDFEGYRVYIARDDRASSYSMLASFDKEDFNKYVYNTKKSPAVWELQESKNSPYTLEYLQLAYGRGDTTWNPLQYTRTSPLTWQILGAADTVMYFEAQDFNTSRFGVNTMIRKVYADTMAYPRPPDTILAWLPDKIPATYPDSLRQKYLTPDNYPLFYEYDYVVENLLPTVQYYVNVTAFDFGSPKSGLPSLETSKTVGSKVTYALPVVDSVKAQDLKAYCYPNPYRIDANYRANGYEGRAKTDRDRPDDRVRLIHFANLPAKCTIKIFTLDGDLVRQIDHSADPTNPQASHETWDLITRNTQLIVSGIYYWTVEDPEGKTQIGKLVIIL
jgi:hypothetical protein